MKSQGLPLNFIVLAALAILILILAAAFVIMGGRSMQRTMSPQAARTNCKNICYEMQRNASTMDYDSSTTMSTLNNVYGNRWCAPQDVQGIGNDKTCVDIGETCYVVFANDVQKMIDCPIS